MSENIVVYWYYYAIIILEKIFAIVLHITADAEFYLFVCPSIE